MIDDPDLEFDEDDEEEEDEEDEVCDHGVSFDEDCPDCDELEDDPA